MQNARDAVARAARLVDEGQLSAAEQIALQIVRQLPDCAAALVLLGIVARKTTRYAEAVDWLQKACYRRPDDGTIRCELGRALADNRQLNEAKIEFQRAIQLNAADAGACLNLGAVLGQLERQEEAIVWCRRAVELGPNDAVAHFNRGNVARSLGLLDEAVAALEAAVRIAPDFAPAHYNLGYCHLLSGDFRRGWPKHEWRVAAGEVTLDDYPQPRWNGESLKGRTILVHAEQGIGDEILFGSCLPDLIAQAGRTIVVCEPRLQSLFRQSFPQADVRGFQRRQDRCGFQLNEPIDFQIPLGSLPMHYRNSRQDFPQRDRYLTADPALLVGWKRRIQSLGAGLNVGISWRAGGQPHERQSRTTTLELWRPLLSLQGVQLVNLQYGDCIDELAAARREMGIEIHDWPDADPLVDMDGFAAKVAALDLVVSVDNSTVHLSGALGVPTWVLLPQVPGWRWTLADTRSLWYPSARLFRQPSRGDWSAVFAQIGELLKRIVESSDASTLLTADGARSVQRQSSIKKRTEHTTTGATVANDPIVLPSNAAASSETGWGPSVLAAKEAYHRGDIAVAESLCRTVLNHSPRNIEAANLLGTIAAQSGRMELAVRTFGRAAALAGDDPSVATNFAAALADSGQREQAFEAYRRLIQQHPNSFDIRLGYAKALHTAEKLEEAVDALQQALRLHPNQHKAFNLLGVWCLNADRLADAESAFRQAIRLHPEYMAAHNNLGLVLERQNRDADAKKCFSRAYKLDRNCLQAANNLTSLENKTSGLVVMPLSHS
jgi:Flp pilus assembly protein TadD